MSIVAYLVVADIAPVWAWILFAEESFGATPEAYVFLCDVKLYFIRWIVDFEECKRK